MVYFYSINNLPMKNFLNLLLLFSAFCTVKSKTGRTNISAQEQAPNVNERKQSYILKQSYLSKSVLKDYQSYYGDSLQGFDEQGISKDLQSRFYFGREFIDVMNFHKREFI